MFSVTVKNASARNVLKPLVPWLCIKLNYSRNRDLIKSSPCAIQFKKWTVFPVDCKQIYQCENSNWDKGAKFLVLGGRKIQLSTYYYTYTKYKCKCKQITMYYSDPSVLRTHSYFNIWLSNWQAFVRSFLLCRFQYTLSMC